MASRQFTARRSGRTALRRPRRPILVLAGITIPLVLVGGASIVLAATAPKAPAAAAAEPNPNCTLVVPADPLSAQGLATPYQMVATDPAEGVCHEADSGAAQFVEATVLDPATGALGVYHPLVIDQGTTPVMAPVVPTLPAGAVVGIWFGSNGETLTLKGATGTTLRDAKCVNGLGQSLFGQYAYCNAVPFFDAANKAIAAKKLVIPPAQKDKNGEPCPTVRDFKIVDQDQSDNVISNYLVDSEGRTAQNSAANRTTMGDGKYTVMSNGSDNALVAKRVDPLLGCTAWTAPNLADPGAQVASLALNELSAAAWRNTPIARIPTNNPMTEVDGKPSGAKTNLYRAGVDQPLLGSHPDYTYIGRLYCEHLVNNGPKFLVKDRTLLEAGPSPDPAAAINLWDFMAQRLHASYDLLGCAKLLHKKNPINLQVNAAGKVNNAIVAPDAASPSPVPSVEPSQEATAPTAADPAASEPAGPVPSDTPGPTVSAQHF